MSESAPFTSGLDTSVSGLKKLIKNHLKFTLARDPQTASKRDWWLATSKAVQSIVIERMIATQGLHHRKNVKRVYYLSLEFLRLFP
jgi:glycogen phosphorylase